MANKKVSSIEEAAKVQDAGAGSPDEIVKIKLARDGNEGKGLYVNVNDHNFWIPRGQVVEVPRYIANVIQNSIDQDEHTQELIESLSGKAEY